MKKFDRKEYMKEYNKNYRHTLNGWCNKTLGRIKERGFALTFNKKELKTWRENWFKGQISEKIKSTRKNLTSYLGNHKVKVYVVELNKCYESIKQCTKELKTSESFISRCICGKRNSSQYTFSRLGVNSLD